MISVYLCDDDTFWLNRLNKAVTDYQIKSNWEMKIALQTTSPMELLGYLTEHSTLGGIYFLDIDLKSSINGMDVAKQIRSLDSHASIIFVTVHDELVMETFRLKLSVLDYIIKDSSSLSLQIHHCLSYLEEKNMTVEHSAPTVTIRISGFYHTVALQDIYYIETIKNTHKVSLHLNSAVYTFSDSISSLKERLGDDFYQCHKAYLVNLRHISVLDTTKFQLLLDNGEHCPCSVRSWKHMVQKYCILHGA